MKHTKNILKSLLITVMALSLLAVSCKKDEGGSKPTDPTPTTISEQNIVETLQGFETVATTVGSVNFKTGVTEIKADGVVDLTVAKEGNTDLTLTTFKTEMKTKLEQGTQSIASVAVADTTPTANAPAANNKNPVVFELTITAKTGYVLDAGIKGYDSSNKTVKLTLKFTPSEAWK